LWSAVGWVADQIGRKAAMTIVFFVQAIAYAVSPSGPMPPD